RQSGTVPRGSYASGMAVRKNRLSILQQRQSVLGQSLSGLLVLPKNGIRLVKQGVFQLVTARFGVALDGRPHAVERVEKIDGCGTRGLEKTGRLHGPGVRFIGGIPQRQHDAIRRRDADGRRASNAETPNRLRYCFGRTERYTDIF